MRRGFLAACVVALLVAVPAQSSVPKQDSSDGCLVVQNGSGLITVVVRGGMFGRFLYGGRVTIENLSPGDGKSAKVSGAADVRTLSDTKTMYVGTSVRFRISSGSFRVVINAVGIDLSVVGRGTAVLSTTGLQTGFDPGHYSADSKSFCSAGFKVIPDTPTKVQIGAPGATSGGTG